jgi:hypothetical protein
VRKKATLGGNQRRQVLRHETHPIGSPTKETHPTSMCLQYQIIGNRLYSMLLIWQRSVADLSNPLLMAFIGNGLYKPITDRFNICNGLSLTSVIKNLCNGPLRSPLSEVHIGNGRCGGQPRGHHRCG